MNKDTEIFQDIPGYAGYYQASTFSRIKSLRRKVYKSDGSLRYTQSERILNQSMMGGYFAVNLHKDGEMKSFHVHQLLTMTFYDHEPNGMALIVNHRDNNPLNNHIDNLEIVTNRYNSSCHKKGGTSGYLGVSWHKGAQKFRGQIEIDGKNVYLGLSDSELTLSVRYQRKLISIGEFIRTGTIMDFIKVIDPADTKPVDGLYELA